MQIYTGDRVGDYIMQGAQALGGGIGGGMASMADAFAKAQEKKKQLAAQGKAADAFMKSNPEALNALGMTPEDWALQSPMEKHAAMQGAIGAQAFAQGAQQGQMRTLQMLEMERNLAARDAEEANAGKAGAFFGDMGRLMKPQAPEPGAEGPTMPGLDAFSAIGEATKSSGFALPKETVDDFLKQGMQQNVGGAAQFFNPDQFGKGTPVLRPDGTPVPGAYVTPLGPNSSTTVTNPTLRTKPEPDPVTVPDIAFDPDDKTFEAGLKALPQKERDAAVEFRRKLKAARKSDSLEEAMALLREAEAKPGMFESLKRFFTGGGKAEAPAAAPMRAPKRFNPATGQLEDNR